MWGGDQGGVVSGGLEGRQVVGSYPGLCWRQEVEHGGGGGLDRCDILGGVNRLIWFTRVCAPRDHPVSVESGSADPLRSFSGSVTCMFYWTSETSVTNSHRDVLLGHINSWSDLALISSPAWSEPLTARFSCLFLKTFSDICIPVPSLHRHPYALRCAAIFAAPAFFMWEHGEMMWSVFVTCLAMCNVWFYGCRMGLSPCGRMKGIDEVAAGW